MNYTPRRASKRWLEGAPEYVLDCFDSPKHWDRYTVMLGGTWLEPVLLKRREVYHLDMSSNPTHPQGYSQWGEMPANSRDSHRRVRWLDLPENIREHVAYRCRKEE